MMQMSKEYILACIETERNWFRKRTGKEPNIIMMPKYCYETLGHPTELLGMEVVLDNFIRQCEFAYRGGNTWTQNNLPKP